MATASHAENHFPIFHACSYIVVAATLRYTEAKACQVQFLEAQKLLHEKYVMNRELIPPKILYVCNIYEASRFAKLRHFSEGEFTQPPLSWTSPILVNPPCFTWKTPRIQRSTPCSKFADALVNRSFFWFVLPELLGSFKNPGRRLQECPGARAWKCPSECFLSAFLGTCLRVPPKSAFWVLFGVFFVAGHSCKWRPGSQR